LLAPLPARRFQSAAGSVRHYTPCFDVPDRLRQNGADIARPAAVREAIVSGAGGIERQAKAEFERELLGHIIRLSAEDGIAPAEAVEQAIGYYRHTEDGNPVQQVLGRRLRAAIVSLQSTRVLTEPPPGCYAVTPYGRVLYSIKAVPWWRRALVRFRLPAPA
jgi:hypothetical protein